MGGNTKGRLTFGFHSHVKTLLQPTVLASIPKMLVDLAVHTATALVRNVLPDAPLEETFATFATDGTVMPPCRFKRKNDFSFPLSTGNP